jgi:hypothetical protein
MIFITKFKEITTIFKQFKPAPYKVPVIGYW